MFSRMINVSLLYLFVSDISVLQKLDSALDYSGSFLCSFRQAHGLFVRQTYIKTAISYDVVLSISKSGFVYVNGFA